MTVPLPKVMQASKWLQLQTLIDVPEMESLFQAIGPVKIYLVGNVTEKGKGLIPHEAFLEQYAAYIAHLKWGSVPDPREFRPYFSSILTLKEDYAAVIPLENNQELVRVLRPVVQMQMHSLGYSTLDKKFRSNVMGKDSIQWGIQFSYPQLYMDPETNQVEKVLSSDRFVNTSLFRTIQKWMREKTIPTPFQVEGIKTNVPIRIGKQCLKWIHQHSQLGQFGIKVLV